MASSFSTDLKIELMATGENSGTWGDKTNSNLNLIQQAIAGYQSIALTSTNTTLAMTNATISDARNAVLEFTGTITANCTIFVESGIEKTYLIKNSTSGAFTIALNQVGGSSVIWDAADKSLKNIYLNGTNATDTGLVSETGVATLTQKTLTTPTLTAPIINEIDDNAGNEFVIFSKTTSAVNEFTVTNAATGNAPEISATGGDTNIDLKITPKGSGKINLDGIKFPNADGSANQVLKTDGSGNLSFATPSAGFSGSTTTSSAVDITLTSASTQVHFVTMTAASKAVILPDATTLTTKGTPIFEIVNNGTYNFGIQNNSGFNIFTLKPSNAVTITLVDNSTAAGIFTVAPISNSIVNLSYSTPQIVKAGTTGASVTVGQNHPWNWGVSASKLSSTSAIIFYVAGTSNRDVYGVVVSYSGTTITVNSETLLYSGSSTAAVAFGGVALDASTGLIVVIRAANKICVPFTISGTTITAGTASATFGTAYTSRSDLTEIVAASSTLACFMDQATADSKDYKLRTIQHNGASAPTISSQSSATITVLDGVPGISAISATQVFIAYSGGADQYTIARIGTLSGTSTPVLETANTTSTVVTNGFQYTPFIKQISSTEFITVGIFGSDKYTVSGTTVTYVSSTLYSSRNDKYISYYNMNFVFFGSTPDVAITTIYSQIYLQVMKKDGDAYFAVGTQDFPQNLVTTNPSASAFLVVLDSTTVLVATNNSGIGNNVLAYIIKYIGS
jgi:hypothetical protein